MAYSKIFGNGGESGTTAGNGTGVTTGNSGTNGDTAFDASAIGSGNTCVYDSAQKALGSFSLKYTQASTVQNWMGKLIGSASGDLGGMFAVRWDNNPSTTTTIFRLFSDAGYTTTVFSINITNSTFRLQVAENGQTAVSSTATNHLPDTWYLITWRYIQASSSFVANSYVLGETTPFATASATVVGSYTLQSTRRGIGTASSGMGTLWFDLEEFGTGGLPTRLDVTIPMLDFAAVNSSTGWTASTGTVLAAISGSAAAYITSSNNPTNLILDLQLPAISEPAADLTVYVTARRDNSSSGSIVGRLYNGATLIATATSVVVQAVDEPLNVVFASADIAAITPSQWAAGLRVTLSATAA